MATPRDNTEVIRMLNDFKNAIYKSATPLHMPSPAFSYSGYGRANVNTGIDFSQIATKLNFSNLDDTSKMISQSSSVLDDSIQTPEVLKRKLACAEVELQASKAALKAKESAMSMMEPTNKKVCLSLEQKIERSEKRLKTNKENIVQLENKLKYALSDVSTLRNQLTQQEADSKKEYDKLQMKMMSLQQELSNSRQELSAVKSEKAEAIRKLNNEMGRLELKYNSVSQEASMSKDLIQSLKQQVQEWTEKATASLELQEQLRDAQLKIKTLEDQIEADKEKVIIVNSLQSELKLLPELQKENLHLKEELAKYKDSNVALYQEKMWSLQEKLSQAEKKSILLAKLQVENERLNAKITEWESLLDDNLTNEKKSPSTFSRRLSYYQTNEVILTNKVSKISAHCEAVEKENKLLSLEVEKLKKNLEEMKNSFENKKNLVERLQRRLLMLTRNRDSFWELINSYISETSLNSSQSNKSMDETIKDYRNILKKAEEEIEDLGKQVDHLSQRCKANEQSEMEIKQLAEEKKKLLSKLEHLEKEKVNLEMQFASRNEDRNSKSEKIIHLRCNPFETAVQKQITDLKCLKEENDRLKKRIAVLEEEGALAVNITAKVEEKLEKEGSESELQDLKKQLAAIELQNKMIIDTARNKSREFRETVYRLTGYKIDVPTSGKYKLSHLYAESADDFLLFEVNSRSVNLLETEYSKHLTEYIEMYLQAHDSMPAFLASVTLELFNQQTCIAQKSMSIT